MSFLADISQILKTGKRVQFRPKGNSMLPRIKSGQLVTVEPRPEYKKGEIVLCYVGGRYFLHEVKAVEFTKGYLIGNVRGHLNGWTKNVYGKVVSIED